MKTLCVDASTTHVGLALFHGIVPVATSTLEFKGTYDLTKLRCIVDEFESYVSDKADIDLIIIEQPIAMLRNSATVSSLGQVAGALAAIGFMYKCKVEYVHPMKVRKCMGTKCKEDTIKKAKKLFGLKVGEHGADALMLYPTYQKIKVNNLKEQK